MNADRIIEVLLALLTFVIGFTSFWLATKTTRIQGNASIRAVDAGAFERAREIYEAALGTLRDELSSARADLATARSDLSATRADLATARTDIAGMQVEIARMHAEIARLRQDQNGARLNAPVPGR